MNWKTYTILAQEGPPQAAKQAAPDGGIFGNPMLLMLLLMGLFFVVVILPQSRRQKREQEELLKNIKPGSKVVLNSGIVARVVKDHEDGELTISSDDTRLRVLKTSIISVQGEEPATK